MLKNKRALIIATGLSLLCTFGVWAEQTLPLYNWTCISSGTGGWNLSGAWTMRPAGSSCPWTASEFISGAVGNDGCSTDHKCVLGHTATNHHQECVCSSVEVNDNCTALPNGGTKSFCYSSINI
jgi:hypothetical protein